jgi:hypothetical protein
MEKSQIAAEGYWRPGRIGGHDHVVEPDFGFGRDTRRERGWRRA